MGDVIYTAEMKIAADMWSVQSVQKIKRRMKYKKKREL